MFIIGQPRRSAPHWNIWVQALEPQVRVPGRKWDRISAERVDRRLGRRVRPQRSMVGLMFRRSRLAQQPVALYGAYVIAVGAKNAGVPEKADVRTVGREDVPTIYEGDVLALRAEKMF